MRDDSTDTIRLTELFFARDEEALRETARLYEPLCMHIALNILADRQDAEECINDTWLRAWNHIPPDRPRSMAAYLGTIVRNLAINRWRAGDAVFFIPEDENGQLSMTEFCLLRDGASGVILLPGTLQTGDRVRVPRGAFLYSDPPILVLKRAPVLVEHGTEDSIDPAIRQQVTDRLSATGLTVSN